MRAEREARKLRAEYFPSRPSVDYDVSCYLQSVAEKFRADSWLQLSLH